MLNERGRLDPADRRRLLAPADRRRLLAVACLDEIRGATHEILTEIERAIPALVPPYSMDDAEALSHAGERVIPYLAQTITPDDAYQQLPVIRTAMLIGGTDALNLITEIAQHCKARMAESYESYRPLRDEFTRAWQYFEPKVYADKVIFPLGIHEVRVTDWRLLEVIAKASAVTEITLSVFVKDGSDLSALDGAQISSLSIEDCDISSLTGVIRYWPSIKDVTLRRCRRLEDVTALNLLRNLEQLEILYCDKMPSNIPSIAPDVKYRVLRD